MGTPIVRIAGSSVTPPSSAKRIVDRVVVLVLTVTTIVRVRRVVATRGEQEGVDGGCAAPAGILQDTVVLGEQAGLQGRKGYWVNIFNTIQHIRENASRKSSGSRVAYLGLRFRFSTEVFWYPISSKNLK